MKITQRFKNAINSFNKVENSNSTEEIALSRKFLKYGSQKPLVQDWSKVVMSDKDLYTGYPYAAITTRANKLTQLAVEHLETEANEATEKSVKEEDSIIHPYLQIIDTSPTFSNQQFWYQISTYLDLVGVYYLLAVRNVEETSAGKVRIGNVQSFKLINPYDVRRIVNEETGEVGGYIETKNGLTREIKPQMIIEMRKLNPFVHSDPYSMTDAAKEYQFALKQAGDYTRHSLKNNMAAPGIISTDVILDREQFQNFVSRITNQEKGLPLFGNGAGAITWDPMQINLDEASLDKITEINRATVFAVSGVSKTLMAIEESGTTRETARVQKDLFLENHVIPQLQLIIDALNQDYKNSYPEDYDKYGYTIEIDNPLKVDKEAESVEVDIEIKEINARSQELDLYNKLVQQGYDKEVAAQFSCGDISIEELSQYTPKEINPPKEIVAPKEAPKKPEAPKEETKPEDSMTPTETDKEDKANKQTKQTITVKTKHTNENKKNDVSENKTKENELDTVDNGKGNPYRDKEGKYTYGPSKSDKSKASKGKTPQGVDETKKYGNNYVETEKQALERIKGSKYTETLYHGTTVNSVEGIKQEGYSLDFVDRAMYGEGVYLAKELDTAQLYEATTTGAGIIQNKINVKNPIIFNTRTGNSFTDEVMIYGKETRQIPQKLDSVDLIPQSKYNKLTRELGNKLLKEHDAIINEGYMDTIVIVRDPKDIITFNGNPLEPGN